MTIFLEPLKLRIRQCARIMNFITFRIIISCIVTSEKNKPGEMD